VCAYSHSPLDVNVGISLISFSSPRRVAGRIDRETRIPSLAMCLSIRGRIFLHPFSSTHPIFLVVTSGDVIDYFERVLLPTYAHRT